MVYWNRNSFKDMEDLKQSEKYAYFKELGYSDDEAVTLSLISLKHDPVMDIVKKKFGEQKEMGFSGFAAKNYFPVKQAPEKEPEKDIFDAFGSFFDIPHKARIKNKSVKQPVQEKAEYKDVILPKAVVSDEFVVSETASYNLLDDGSAVMDSSESSKESEGAFFRDIVSPSTVTDGAAQMRGSLKSVSRPLPEAVRTDSYEVIEEKIRRNVIDSPTATFRPTFNTAAAGILLSNIRDDSYTRRSMVRTEELLNYLNYDLKAPDGRKFEITAERKDEDGKTFLFLGVQGEKTIPSRQNICLLLDVSGSMSSKADSVVLTAATVLSRMNPGDILSLVTYANKDCVIINGLKLDENKNIDDILELLADIVIDGCTYGSAGINKAYDIIQENMIEDGVNRVIIITDGDLNFGIHDKDGLIGLIEKKRESGAYFSAIGTGIYNLQDDKLEGLAKNGNGNYFVINSISDIRRTIRDNYEALVYPIAKNVKAQMEFNPKTVRTWKLVGYENRTLNHEDFRNDKVIAEPFGSGSYFIALFELQMNEGEDVQSSLKYQKIETVDSQDIGTLTVRFEDVDDQTVKEIEFTVDSQLSATENIDKAIECAKIAEKLRKNDVDELTRKALTRILK